MRSPARGSPARQQPVSRDLVLSRLDFEARIETATRLVEQLGVDETQAIHLALREMTVKLLPQYAADDGPLTAAQVRQIKKRVPQTKKRSVRSSLFEAQGS